MTKLFTEKKAEADSKPVSTNTTTKNTLGRTKVKSLSDISQSADNLHDTVILKILNFTFKIIELSLFSLAIGR